MKSAVVGALMFLVGAASSPKAANDGEMTALLCKRFTEAGGDWQMKQQDSDKARREYDAERNPEQRRLMKARWEEGETRFAVLKVLRAVACGVGTLPK